MLHLRLVLFSCLLLIFQVPLSAQLSNTLFNGTFNHLNLSFDSLYTNEKLKEIPGKFNAQVLHYLKNNEYMERHNPGETFFGMQVALGTMSYLQHKHSKVYLGVLMDIPYGNHAHIKGYPLVQFQHQWNPNHQLILGSIHGNTRHQLYEPLYNYELNVTRPVEYGIQYLFQNTHFQSDIWLDWRQQAVTQASIQEHISFGLSSQWHINPTQKNHRWSIPFSQLLFHRGGESLSLGKPIHNQWNGSIGLKYQHKNHVSFESVLLGALDFSPSLSHAFRDGHAWYNQFQWNLSKSQKCVISHYYAEEFYAPLGPNLFLSEQHQKPQNIDHYRNFIMVRYQWMKAIIPNICTFDFRVEPIWHIEKKHFAFSTGLYFKYILGGELY
jgi:hypothetical protein